MIVILIADHFAQQPDSHQLLSHVVTPMVTSIVFKIKYCSSDLLVPGTCKYLVIPILDIHGAFSGEGDPNTRHQIYPFGNFHCLGSVLIDLWSLSSKEQSHALQQLARWQIRLSGFHGNFEYMTFLCFSKLGDSRIRELRLKL